MKNKFNLSEILKDSNYNLNLFSDEEVKSLEHKIIIKKEKPFVNCVVRDKEIQLKPEEVVRQLYASKLINEYGYSKERMKFEHAVKFGREVKSADIVIFDKDRPMVEYLIVEVKKPKLLDGKAQLRSYCNATGAPIAVWTNGEEIFQYNRKDPNYFEDLTDIPREDQSLEDILTEKFTYRDLIINDKIPNKGTSLKEIVKDIEDEVLSGAGVDSFEEVFKLIFIKLYDEKKRDYDKRRLYKVIEKHLGELKLSNYDQVKKLLENEDNDLYDELEFRNKGQSEGDLKKKLQKLFDEAKGKWKGIFSDDATIQLAPSHLSVCVAALQDVKLTNSNLDVIDEAFEYLVSKTAKGEKGQYFTPRYVIDMCVKMLNPKADEYMIDTASGSCGFPVHMIFWLHKKTGRAIEDLKDEISRIFGIDFDEKAVRVARTLNVIAGDGHTNVLHLNTLDYERWNETIDDMDWMLAYGEGLKRLDKLKTEKESYKQFQFDLLMANPPFAGDIKESRILHKYNVGFNKNNKAKPKVGRDLLFIERNLDFLKAGGRMAIVLPQGRFNNTSDKEIRDYISEKARILAVVGLHGNTFKPHTGTKTSVLFVQKWDDKLCPKKEDYPIFFAVSENGGKDNSGEYVYLKNEIGERKLDKQGHLIIEQDLHNHDGELPDGVAEAFCEFAKKEGLSFSE